MKNNEIMSENNSVTTWQEALIYIIQASASIAPILLMLPSKSNESIRLLLPFSTEDNTNIVQFINNKTVYVTNQHFQPLEPDIKYYRLFKSNFVVGFLNYNASDLKTDVSTWIKNDLWTSRGVVVVFVMSEVTTPAQIADEVLQELWRQCQAANAYVVVQNTRKKFLIYKGAAYTSSCAVQPREVNIYQAFKQETISNVNSCLLKAVAVATEPYVFALNSSQFFTDGLEVRIFETLADILNFKIKYVFSPSNEEPYDTGLKGPPRGSLGVLSRREADIMFHGVRMSWDRSVYADALDPYHASSFVWALPLPEPMPVWKTFFIVFDTPMWCGVVFVLPVVGLCFWSFTRNSPITDIALAIMQMSLNTSTQFHFTSYTFKLFISLFFVYVVNVTAAYQAGLFQILSHGILYRQPTNEYEALQMGFTLQIYPSMKSVIQESSPNFFEYLTSSGRVDWTTDIPGACDRIAKGERLLALTTDVILKYQIIQRYSTAHGKAHITMLKQRYAPYEIVFYMSKDHPLFSAFQSKLRVLVEMGLVDKFLGVVFEKSMYNRHYWPTAEILHRDLSKLYAIFAILVMALTGSCLCFAIECFHKNKK